MNKIVIVLFSALVFSACSPKGTSAVSSASDTTASAATTSFFDFSILSLDEASTLNMADFKGKKILVVNVASKCGYTPQYEGLQKLHEQYGEQVQIIGFPCNQFMGQEPGGKEEIASFCKKNFGVTFPLTTKIDVKGDSQHPIYAWLTQQNQNGLGDFKVSWNFNKFLIDENGKLLQHFGSKTEPMSEEMIAAIQQ